MAVNLREGFHIGPQNSLSLACSAKRLHDLHEDSDGMFIKSADDRKLGGRHNRFQAPHLLSLRQCANFNKFSVQGSALVHNDEHPFSTRWGEARKTWPAWLKPSFYHFPWSEQQKQPAFQSLVQCGQYNMLNISYFTPWPLSGLTHRLTPQPLV